MLPYSRAGLRRLGDIDTPAQQVHPNEFNIGSVNRDIISFP
jgi:hypothetical protein